MGSLNVFFLNVCGIKSKLRLVEFTNIIESYDILVFVETKLDDLDVLDVPKNYSYVTKNRTKMCKKSGGIVIIYKKILENYLSFIDNECQFVQWVKLSKSLLNLDRDVILGAVYIPPENTKYSSSEAFDDLENELMTYCKNSNLYTAFVGDFNAKTGTLSDYIIPDDTLLDILQLDGDDEILSYLFDFEKLQLQNIPLRRVSECTCTPNNYGYKLLNFCKKLNLYIANSRVGVDKGIGKKTCKSTSVVDYLLLSSKLFSIVKEFEIQDFNPLISDVHNAIHIIFKSTTSQNINIQNTSHNPEKVTWRDNKRTDFVNTIHNNQNELINIVNDLQNLDTRDNCTQQDIDEITTKINELFHTAAQNTLTVKKSYLPKPKHDSKPWYTEKCFASRKKFHKARKR